MSSSSKLTTALFLFFLLIGVFALPICLPVSRDRDVQFHNFLVNASEFSQLKQEVEDLRQEIADLRNEIRSQTPQVRMPAELQPRAPNSGGSSVINVAETSDAELVKKREALFSLVEEYNRAFAESLAAQIQRRKELFEAGYSREDIEKEIAEVVALYDDRLAAPSEQISRLSREIGEQEYR